MPPRRPAFRGLPDARCPLLAVVRRLAVPREFRGRSHRGVRRLIASIPLVRRSLLRPAVRRVLAGARPGIMGHLTWRQLVNDRTVIVHDQPVVSETRVVEDGGSNALIFGIIAVIAIVIIGLFVWQPWNATNTTTSNTTVTTGQPADGSSSSTTTTTTNGTTNSGSSTTTSP